MTQQQTIEAFVDGELAPAEAAALEAQAKVDSGLADRIERVRALRAAVAQAYDDIDADPMPARFLAMIADAAQPADTVVDLARARAARRRVAVSAPARWGALAASLALAFLGGRLIGPPSSINGALMAQGRLAAGLNSQLASSQAQDAHLRIGVTFRSQGGDYCRTFTDSGWGGLACRHTGGWRVEVAQATAALTAETPAYRTAGSNMPPAVLDAMDRMIAGEPLDAAGERAARDSGWRSTK